MISRRGFLVSAGAGAAAASLSSFSFAANAAKGGIPLGIQLWTVKEEAAKDLEGTMKKLYEIGFREIEFAGFYGKTAAEIGALMKGIGFKLVSMHASADDIAAKGDSIIADAKTLGLRYIICSSPMSDAAKAKLEWAKKMEALDAGDWKMNAELFNKFGKSVKAAGMQFGYHNHYTEFKKFGGKTALDILLESTDPDLVKSELDVCWAVVGGDDPIRILDKYKDRVVALHVKDIAKITPDPHDTETIAVGQGSIDWKKVIGTAKANGTKAFFYEQEAPFSKPILESAKESADYLKKLAV